MDLSIGGVRLVTYEYTMNSARMNNTSRTYGICAHCLHYCVVCTVLYVLVPDIMLVPGTGVRFKYEC